jgi:hypothetical protein
MSKITRNGLIYAVLGFLLLVIRTLLDHWDIVNCTIVGSIFLDLLRDIGIGCIVLGIFNLILSRSDWQEYFEERLRQIVMSHQFLASLGGPALRQIVRAVIRAQSPGAPIEREGGFLEFFENHLYHFISAPYRENAAAEISYTNDPTNSEAFSVVDKFSYTLRTVGSKSLPPLRFELDPSECIDGGKATIRIKIPDRPLESGQTITLADDEPLEKTAEGGYQIERLLPKEYATLDYLEVTFEATYSSTKGRIQVWWILIPTRDVTLILSYPREWSIQAKDFVQAHKLANSTRWPGYFMFRYPSWILPGGGIAWGFLRKSDETEKQVQEVFEET